MLIERKISFIKIVILNVLILLSLTACSTAPKTQANPVYSYSLPSNLSNSIGDSIVRTARAQIGQAYTFGGESPSEGFDCSGLSMYSHQLNGINIPRQAAHQYMQGKHIKKNALSSGDLLFFTTYKKGASHVGIYMGNGLFIHSPNKRKNVQIETLNNSYYNKRYLGARRYW